MKLLEMELSVTNLANEKDYFIALPVGEEELTKFVNTVSNNGENDYIISDVLETDIHGFVVSDYDNIYKLNEFMNYINDVEEYEQDIILSLIELGEPTCLKDTEDVSLDDYILEYDLNNYYDVGYYFYTSAYGEPDDMIKNYFDFEKYGKDIMINDYYCGLVSKGFIYCVA